MKAIFFFFFLFYRSYSFFFNFNIKKEIKKNYKNILFPNQTKEIINSQQNKKKELQKELEISFLSKNNEITTQRNLLPDINKPPAGVENAICVICRGLEYCTALNGLLIQEVYYPQSNSKLGTCHIIDQLGERMYNEIFGIGRTFRDTPQCRLIVMQYLCLFWGTENDMYTNLCFWKEDTSNPDPTLHEATGRPPCRSFCVQVRNCFSSSSSCYYSILGCGSLCQSRRFYEFML